MKQQEVIFLVKMARTNTVELSRIVDDYGKRTQRGGRQGILWGALSGAELGGQFGALGRTWANTQHPFMSSRHKMRSTIHDGAIGAGAGLIPGMLVGSYLGRRRSGSKWMDEHNLELQSAMEQAGLGGHREPTREDLNHAYAAEQAQQAAERQMGQRPYYGPLF